MAVEFHSLVGGGGMGMVCAGGVAVKETAQVPLFPFRVYPMEDDMGQIYYYAQADNIPECNVVGYSPGEVFELMAEAQEVWLDIFLDTEEVSGESV